MKTLRRRWIVALIAPVILLNLLWLGTAIYLQRVATTLSYDPRKSFAESFGTSDRDLTRGFDHDRYLRLTKHDLQLTSDYEYPIRGMFIEAPGTPRGTVLINGYTLAVMPVADIFLDRGFNILTWYLVTGKTSYGHREKRDFAAVLRFARTKDPRGAIGAVGGSGIGAAMLQYAGTRSAQSDVAFYVIDAAFSDLMPLFRYHLRIDYGLPNLLLVECASLINRLRDGYYFGEISPVRSIASVHVPVLFIHGTRDRVIPYRMSEELYRAKPGARLFLTHDGGHRFAPVGTIGLSPQLRQGLERKVDTLLAHAELN